MKTLQSQAVLLYMGSGGHVERDFLALELIDGRPSYVFDTGNGPRHIDTTSAASAGPAVNDGQWHDVAIVRSDLTSEYGHSLVVDGQAFYDLYQPVSYRAVEGFSG